MPEPPNTDSTAHTRVKMTDKKQHPEAQGGKRKSYQAPKIVSREPLEALAAVCNQPGAKEFPTNPNCNSNVAQS